MQQQQQHHHQQQQQQQQQQREFILLTPPNQRPTMDAKPWNVQGGVPELGKEDYK